MSPFRSEVAIELDSPVALPDDYVEKHRLLSSEDRRIHVLYRGERLYSTRVPKGVFNPYRGVAANILIEAILAGAVPVAGRRVVDLGCGSGVIGLAAIREGAASVLFSDVNPRVLPLRDHPMLRPADRVKVQDLLTTEADASFDTLLMSTPTNEIDAKEVEANGAIAPDTFEGAIYRSGDFLGRLAAEAARVLVPGGSFAAWVKIPTPVSLSAPDFFPGLSRDFDPGTMRVLWSARESEVAVGSQRHADDRSHLVFSIRRR